MPVVAVLHHLDTPFLGHVTALGLSLDQRHLRRCDPLPELDAVDGIVSLGGEQSVGDPELEPEVALLREASTAGMPVLGVCLGGQLLAHALGARVWRPGRRVLWRELPKLEAAARDPLFADIQDPVPALNWNQDVFSLPAGGEALVDGEGDSVQAFRHGRAWGVQYHPDVDAATLDGWMQRWSDQIPEPEAFRAESARYAPVQARASAALFGGFARVVAGR